MSVVTVVVNARRYEIACGEGQENHVLQLAGEIDRRVRQLAAELGPVDDIRLLLLASLILADELTELRSSPGRTSAGGAGAPAIPAADPATGSAGEPGMAEPVAVAAELRTLAARIDSVAQQLAPASSAASSVAVADPSS